MYLESSSGFRDHQPFVGNVDGKDELTLSTMLIARVLYSINLDQFNGVNAHFQTKINIFMSIDFEIALIIKALKLFKITVIPMILFYITHLKMTECN